MSALIHFDGGVAKGTHALVIGIGKYPYLRDGEHAVADPDGMGQLSSPPVSARAFAGWLLTEHHDPDKPLASLTLLLSEEHPTPFVNARDGAAHEVGNATIADIVEAVREWKDRGDSDADNRLIFYFCGHGVSQGVDLSLLASDVFADVDNPLNGALDFRRLLGGLRRCKASQQVFFVDACRASSDVLIERSGGFAGAVPLGGERRPLDLPRLLHVPYYATLPGERSYALRGAVSVFTTALLKSLRGAGSDDAEGDWQVTTIRLHEALSHFMSQPKYAGEVSGIQTPAIGESLIFPIHWLSNGPVVPVYVTCREQEDNAAAEFICRRSGQERLRRAAPNGDEDAGGEWIIELESGEYEFEARVRDRVLRIPPTYVRPTYRRIRLAAGT